MSIFQGKPKNRPVYRPTLSESTVPALAKDSFIHFHEGDCRLPQNPLYVGLEASEMIEHIPSDTVSILNAYLKHSIRYSKYIQCPSPELRGHKIDKNRQHPQDTCSKKPGVCFFWGRRSAAGSDHQTHRAGDHNLVSKQCQRKTLSKNSGAKPCQRNILSKSYILTVSDGIFWVSPIYLLYLMECFKLKGKGRVNEKGKFIGI